MADAILVSFKDAVLRGSDAQTLQPNEWISDAVLVLFYEVLSQRYPDAIRREKMSLWQPSVTELMCSLGEYSEGVLPTPSDVVFLPISDRYMDPSSISTHWSLLVVTPSAAFHLDSLSTSNEEAARYTLAQYQACYAKQQKLSFIEVPMPSQCNAFDCGLYPIFIAHSILARQESASRCDVQESIEQAAASATPDKLEKLRHQCSEWVDRWALLVKEDRFPMEEWSQVKNNIGVWEDIRV